MKTWLQMVTTLVVLGVVLTLFPASSDAARRSKGSKVKVQLETYPAIEDIEVAAEATPSEIRVAPTLPAIPSTESLEVAAKTRALEERMNLLEKRYVERAAFENPRTATPRASTATFERVPPNKTDMIASRLKLIEEILRESGRAYDYRTMTSNQLRRVLQEIQNEKSRAGVTALAE